MNTLRSLARFVAEALPDFEVMWAPDEGELSRPWARVTPSTPLASLPLGTSHRELRQTFSVLAFPSAFAATDEAAIVEAKRVERRLLEAATGGRWPMAVALYDYSDVALRAPAPDDALIGFMKLIEPPTFTVFPESAGDRLYLAAVDLRLRWTERARPLSTGAAAQTVGVRSA
jgi:hypothetical protein